MSTATATTRFSALSALSALVVATEREWRYREATRDRLYREMLQPCPDSDLLTFCPTCGTEYRNSMHVCDVPTCDHRSI